METTVAFVSQKVRLMTDSDNDSHEENRKQASMKYFGHPNASWLDLLQYKLDNQYRSFGTYYVWGELEIDPHEWEAINSKT